MISREVSPELWSSRIWSLLDSERIGMKFKQRRKIPYGVYDTKDRVWMGSEKGIALFKDKRMAEVSSAMTNVQLGWDPGRCRAKPFLADAVGMHIKDEVITKMGAKEALAALEEGREIG
jgi:hypothetical protein